MLPFGSTAANPLHRSVGVIPSADKKILIIRHNALCHPSAGCGRFRRLGRTYSFPSSFSRPRSAPRRNCRRKSNVIFHDLGADEPLARSVWISAPLRARLSPRG